MRITELMRTPAVACTSSRTLGQVARLMRERNVGSVVVVDNMGYLAGIVTDRDLAIRGLAADRTADSIVAEVMTRDVVTVPIHADVNDAMSMMAKHAVRRLPVVDEQNMPRGIVALDDLVRHLGRQTDAVTDALLSQATTLSIP